ncbi:DNA polymerase III subunit gamma and tau [Nakamurella silvestris]|nr:DNA polymerase III subunit gamma and tau [Nakamurella silvestris]
MALALYRKYRPATFAEVVGQEHVTDPLRTALAAGKINHAYLFSGPRGCGKTSSARILARSLNCVEGPTPDPCGVCPSCVALAPEGPGSLDVVELDAASHGGVEDTRDLRDKAFYMPAESRYRIFIVDEAHMVSPQGFNALLKIVEEPPEHLVFIFATTEPDKVLTTIRSRTHHYPFRLIPPATLRALLERLCVEEQVQVEPAVFPLVIRAGGGSARDSLSILDQLLAGAGPEGVTYRNAVALLGVTDASLLDEIVDAFAAADGASVFGAVDKVVEAGHDPRRFAADLLQRFRDLVIMAAVPDAAAKGIIDAPEDQLAAMVGQSERIGAGTLTRLADVLHTGLVDMRGTTSPRLVLELMCARMLLPGASLSDGALLQRLERIERRLAIAGDSPEQPGLTAVPAATPAVAGPPAEDVRAAPLRPAAESASKTAYRRPSQRSDSPAAPTAAGPASPPAAPVASVPAGTPGGPEPVAVPTPAAAAPQPAAPPAVPEAVRTAPAAPATKGNPALGLPAKPVLSSVRSRPTAAPVVDSPAAVSADPGAVPAAVGVSAPTASVPAAVPVEPEIPASTVPSGSDDDWPLPEEPADEYAEPEPTDGGGRGGRPTGRRFTEPPRAQRPDPVAAVRAAATAPAPQRSNGAAPAAAPAPAAVAPVAPAPTVPAPAAPATPAAPASPAAPPAAAEPTSAEPTRAEPTRAEAAASVARASEVDVTDVRRTWQEILAAVQKRRRTTQILLAMSTVSDVSGNALHLTMPSPGMARRVLEPANADLLREALKEVLGVDWAIRCEAGSDTPPRAAQARAAQTAAAPAVEADPQDDIPDDYDASVADPPGQYAPRDPEEVAIELLTQQLGATRIDPEV